MEHLGTISTLGEEAQDKGWGTSRTLPDLSVIGFSEFNATSDMFPSNAMGQPSGWSRYG